MIQTSQNAIYQTEEQILNHIKRRLQIGNKNVSDNEVKQKFDQLYLPNIKKVKDNPSLYLVPVQMA